MAFEKGDRVMVEGKLRNNNWVNNQTNEEHHEVYLLISEMRKMAKTSRKNGAESEENKKPKPDYRQEEERQMAKDIEDLPF